MHEKQHWRDRPRLANYLKTTQPFTDHREKTIDQRGQVIWKHLYFLCREIIKENLHVPVEEFLAVVEAQLLVDAEKILAKAHKHSDWLNNNYVGKNKNDHFYKTRVRGRVATLQKWQAIHSEKLAQIRNINTLLKPLLPTRSMQGQAETENTRLEVEDAA